MEQKVALVTGSASGIGAATARLLAKKGWRVVINYARSETEARKVSAECPGSLVVQADVSDDAQCRRLVDTAVRECGRLDALVNNAGTTRFVTHANLDALTGEDFLNLCRINVVAPFQMARAAAPHLKAAKGAVVNVSSVAAHLGTGSSIAYAASKSALNAMTLSLARVLGPDVRVNAVAPGFVDTPWQDKGLGRDKARAAAQRFADIVPLKDYARPEDVADAIAWLVEGARHVTGEILYVDGGMHIQPPK